MMKWLDLAKYVAKFAPLLGGALGGPGGAAIGSILASALGVENDPAKILEVLNRREDTRVLLLKIQSEHRVELEKLQLKHATAVVKEVNTTMREELVHGNALQKSWRPVLGLTFSIGWISIMAAICFVLLTGGDPKYIAAIGEISILFVAPMTILGAAAYGRSNEKIAIATGRRSRGIFSSISDRIFGRHEEEEFYGRRPRRRGGYGGRANASFDQEGFYAEGAG